LGSISYKPASLLKTGDTVVQAGRQHTFFAAGNRIAWAGRDMEQGLSYRYNAQLDGYHIIVDI